MAFKHACSGSGRTPAETTVVNDAKWGRCSGCGQMRPLTVAGWVKVHRVIDGAPTTPDSTSPEESR